MGASALLQEAVLLHRQGSLGAAVERYRQILRGDPANVDAHYYLAMAACQQGRFAEGVDFARAALAIDARRAPVHNLLGKALLRLGRTAAALESFDAAVACQPDFAEAHGNRANALAELGRLAEAVDSYDRALALQPDSPEDLINRGTTLHELGRHQDAIASYDRAIAVHGNLADAHFQRGNVLAHLRRDDEALASYEQALAAAPRHAEALNNRGNVLMRMAQYGSALASFDAALASNPDRIDVLGNRCAALIKLGRFDEALASSDRALAVDPGDVRAHTNRGMALGGLGRHGEALASYDKALRVKPGDVDALNNRGAACLELLDYDEALSSCDQALAIEPGRVDTLCNRGAALSGLGRTDEALQAYTQALAQKPDHTEALFRRGLVLRKLGRHDLAIADFDAAAAAGDHPAARNAAAACRLVIGDWPAVAGLAAELAAGVASGQAIEPFIGLAVGLSPADQLKCAENYVRHMKFDHKVQFVHRATARAKIRVAYLSSDFGRHPVAYLTAQLYELHDRARFDVIGISLGADDGSEIRARLIRAFDEFHDVERQSDEAAAQLIKDLDIDIAVDLNGYTDNSRTGILAHRPAPIQVSWLGYPGTMGAGFIDYVIADDIALPFAAQRFYAERIVHLPNCFQINDSTAPVAPGAPTRSELGLPETGFVFCCFNNAYKIRPAMFDVWMRLLRTVERSVLWLYGSNPLAVANLRRQAQARGVDPARLIFAPGVPLDRHTARQRAADLFLDTLPYNAGATASAALQAGLPVLTCAGDSFVGRMGASLLAAAGVPELVAKSLGEYEALAGRLAAHPEELRGVRRKLESGLPRCRLFDTDRTRRHIEGAYAVMWDLWQQGEKPRGFRVDQD